MDADRGVRGQNVVVDEIHALTARIVAIQDPDPIYRTTSVMTPFDITAGHGLFLLQKRRLHEVFPSTLH
jgi:hypothetical protein